MWFLAIRAKPFHIHDNPMPHQPYPFSRVRSIVPLMLLIAVFLPAHLSAQDTEEQRPIYDLRTSNNELYRGYVLERRADTLHFRTLGGVTFRLPVSRVRELRPTENAVRHDGSGEASDSLSGTPAAETRRRTPGSGTRPYESVFERPASSLFAMPTAYPLPSGEVHLGLYELFFGAATVGIAGYADLSLGTLMLPGVFFDPLFLGAKLSPVHGSSGAVAFGGGMVSADDNAFFVYYGVATVNIGKSWFSLSFSSWQDDDSYDSDSFNMLNLGADLPVSRHVRLMTELWIPVLVEGDGSVLLGVGARVEMDIGFIDIGFYFPSEQRGTYFTYLPWLGGTFVL